MAEEYALPETEKDIRWANIKMAENGFIVSYTEIMKPLSNKMYDHCEHIERDLLFPAEKEDEAWDTYKKFKMIELKQKK